jgi:membrane fusion protein (multidrug efflux system)
MFVGTLILFGLLFPALSYLANNLTHEETDDAFLDADVVAVAPKVAGQVVKVSVDNNQKVKAGDSLVEIDARDLQVAVDQKQAALDSARANTELLKSTLDLARAMVASTQATARQTASEAVASEATAQRVAADLKRSRELTANHTISPQESDTAEAAAKAAEANLRAAQAKAAGDLSKVAQSEAQVGAAVKAFERAQTQTRQAEWDLKAAELNLSYARLTAPIDGFITKKAVEGGDYVQVGQRLMALVPERLYVTANFKETQLQTIRPGQKAEITIDSLTHSPFAGHVDSLMAGSGARFSLLPPENAVGNYVKVVQRIPVKILFDQPLPGDHVLGPGMSVVPSVRTVDTVISKGMVLGSAAILALVIGALWFVAARRS